MPFAAIIHVCLTTPTASSPSHATKVFPSWNSGLSADEVRRFLEFVDKFRAFANTTANLYFYEIYRCGKIPFAGLICYYYRQYLRTAIRCRPSSQEAATKTASCTPICAQTIDSAGGSYRPHPRLFRPSPDREHLIRDIADEISDSAWTATWGTSRCRLAADNLVGHGQNPRTARVQHVPAAQTPAFPAAPSSRWFSGRRATPTRSTT
jgi:hypothetical protein